MLIAPVVLGLVLALTVLTPGQDAGNHNQAIVKDWTNHHVIFSNPGTAEEAMRNGTYDRWLKIVNDPRYVMQQRERSANAAGAPVNGVSGGVSGGVAGGVSAAGPDADVQAQEETGAIEITLEERNALAASSGRPSGLMRAIIPPPAQPSSSEPAGAGSPLVTNRRNRMHKDWSQTEGNNGTTGLGDFPATFTTTSASCTNDFAVYNTGLAGGSSQSTIIAFNKLYSGCTGGPASYWGYNTGSGSIVFNSVVLSPDGTQVAFVESSSTGVASLGVLKWLAGGGSVSSPGTITSVAASSYRGCAAACYTTLAFSGNPNDSYSPPFYDPNTDAIYVGDDGGKLHKFTSIFKSGTPTEASSRGQ